MVLWCSEDGSTIAIVTPFWKILTESQVKGHLKDFLILLVRLKGISSLQFIYTSDSMHCIIFYCVYIYFPIEL